MNLIEAFNLTVQDVALFWTCPFLSTFSALIRAWVSELDLLNPPVFEMVPDGKKEVKSKQTKKSKRERGYWAAGCALGGLAIGFGVACLFLGAIQPTASAIGRVWLLSVIAGYATPIVLRNIDRRVELALKQYNPDYR
ncbi:hypothetical protein KW520_20155 [Vibrio fluvialis]|nr:hypothetical protein [Vibrio fluvialis]